LEIQERAHKLRCQDLCLSKLHFTHRLPGNCAPPRRLQDRRSRFLCHVRQILHQRPLPRHLCIVLWTPQWPKMRQADRRGGSQGRRLVVDLPVGRDVGHPPLLVVGIGTVMRLGRDGGLVMRRARDLDGLLKSATSSNWSRAQPEMGWLSGSSRRGGGLRTGVGKCCANLEARCMARSIECGKCSTEAHG